MVKGWLIFLLVLLSVKAAATDVPEGASGTLPLMYISSEAPITSKTEYVSATMFVDPMGCEWAEAIGSVVEQVPLQIRGRGNWTWSDTFEKKPYKLKLLEGRTLLGMRKGKHWALLAHADGQSFFANRAGFFLGRRWGMPFTPDERAVEVVLNGDYIGLYLLTETVRVGKRRVDINEQRDYQTDPDSITGGWLVELDNVVDNRQMRLPVRGTNLQRFWVTWHTPENLSAQQFNYLYSQMETLLARVFTTDKSSTEWEELLDLPSLARYFLINEMVDHVEAFQGSCFLFKDLGDERWQMGPLWDLGHSLNGWHPKYRYIYDVDGWSTDISRELMQFPRLREEVLRLWQQDGFEAMMAMRDDLHRFADTISTAYACNYQRWPAYYRSTLEKQMTDIDQQIREKLYAMIRRSLQGFDGIDEVTVGPVRENASERLYDLLGRPMKPGQKGIVVTKGRKVLMSR